MKSRLTKSYEVIWSRDNASQTFMLCERRMTDCTNEARYEVVCFVLCDFVVWLVVWLVGWLFHTTDWMTRRTTCRMTCCTNWRLHCTLYCMLHFTPLGTPELTRNERTGPSNIMGLSRSIIAPYQESYTPRPNAGISGQEVSWTPDSRYVISGSSFFALSLSLEFNPIKLIPQLRWMTKLQWTKKRNEMIRCNWWSNSYVGFKS
jgi:hypothetical protein